MSDNIALTRATLARMNMREQAIAPHYEGFTADMVMMARTNPDEANEKFLTKMRTELCEAYGLARTEQRKPFAFSEGIAIIPVHGTLINRFGQSWGFVTGYNFIRAQHNAALLDPDVTHIVHDHNSYGGEAAGCFELAAEIEASRGAKPIIAVVDSNCYSASYALASAADKIIATPSSGVGSIGVVAMHVDMSKMLDDIGIKVTFIHSGDHKVDGNPYEPLSKETKASMQKSINKSRDNFVSLVANNRGMDSKIVYDTEAKTYRADDALEIGLIDKIAAPASALEAILNEDEATQDASNTNPTTESTMSTEQQAAAGAPAAAAAAAAAPAAAAPAAAAPAADAAQNAANAQTAERARISAILNCEDAKGRTDLANHLAFETSMSADAAQALLKKAPTAAAAPATPAANGFAAAMDKANHPNVGADGSLNPGADGGGERSMADMMLADYELASGMKLGEK